MLAAVTVQAEILDLLRRQQRELDGLLDELRDLRNAPLDLPDRAGKEAEL